MLKFLESVFDFMLAVIVLGLYALTVVIMVFVFVIMLMVCIGVAILISPLVLIGLLYDKVTGIR